MLHQQIYMYTFQDRLASGQTEESQNLGNVVGVGIPDGEMTTLLEGQNYDGPYGSVLTVMEFHSESDKIQKIFASE